nr:hypothetical protein [Tanacetum cinerariifolium]
MASKQFSLEPGLSKLNKTGKSSNPSVSKVSDASKKDLEDLFQDFYDEYFDSSKIMKSSTTNVETSINEEVFHEVSGSFQGESSSSLLNDDVQQSPKEVILPQTNIQSISNNMIPNVDEASTLHNVFNERLEDAYFDLSTSFHDPSNVHTYYQPYPHEKKWTKDRSLHTIIDFPNTSESSNDESNVVNAPCRNGAHIGYNCSPKVPIVSNPEPCIDELPQTLTNFHLTRYSGDEDSSAHDSTPNFVNDPPNVFHPPLCGGPHENFQCQQMIFYEPCCGNYEELFRKLLNDVQNIHEELAEYINIPSWNNPAFTSHDDDDENYTIAITPEEPDNSLSMGDEHLDTISATESDEVMNSSVEDLVTIPSESKGIPNNMCRVPFHDNSPPLEISKDQYKELSDSNDDCTSIDDNYFSINNIDYVEASPPESDLVSLDEVKDNNPREKLLNVNLLIAKIKSLNDNPTPNHVLKSPSLFPIDI